MFTAASCSVMLARVRGWMFSRSVFLAILAVVFVALAWRLDWLGFEPVRDEVHFWPTSLRFAAQPLPSVDLLRDYGELNTPLPFLLFGWLEAAAGRGIAAGRWLNLAVLFGTMCLFVLSARGPTTRVLLAATGALSFPYLIGVGVHLYTDMIAAGAALAGLVATRRGRWWLASIAFGLAVSSRQYMIAVPAAIGLWRLVEILRTRGWHPATLRAACLDPMLLACAAGAATLAGWIVFFGGFGPPGEITRQGIQTSGSLTLIPRNGLYFLAVIGAYFVPLEWVLLSRERLLRADRAGQVGVLAGVLAVLFVLFPPLGNTHYGIETMGFLDKMLRRVLGDHDVIRVVVLGGLALIAALRVRVWSLSSALVLVHCVMLMKAHIAWDKYALVCLLCLWYLDADTTTDRVEDRTRADPGPVLKPAAR